ARLQLPNGQIARSAWREKLHNKENNRCACVIKFKMDRQISFGEVLYYTRLAVNDPEAAQAFYFLNVALVRLFSPPDNQLLNMSYSVVASCQATQEIRVINVKDICSVVGMIPHSITLAGGERDVERTRT
ncbi:hypothetical protein EV363DRAFT_1186300, partial [Boletus edulis]